MDNHLLLILAAFAIILAISRPMRTMINKMLPVENFSDERMQILAFAAIESAVTLLVYAGVLAIAGLFIQLQALIILYIVYTGICYLAEGAKRRLEKMRKERENNDENDNNDGNAN